MSSRKFKFISPGVFINEIDNSQTPALPIDIGPALIGRFRTGPALQPVKLNSFSEFIDMFGKPIPGGQGGDVWRDGNTTSPTYSAYAAQAWLRNSSPITLVRLLGKTNKDATAAGYAGWQTEKVDYTTTATDNGGAFGLFICEHDAFGYSTTLAYTATTPTTLTFNGLNLEDVGHDFTITGSATLQNTGSFTTGSQGGYWLNEAINSGSDIHGFTSDVASDNLTVTITPPGADADINFDSDPLACALTGADGLVRDNDTTLAASSSIASPTGTLAAVWYVDYGTIALSGTTLSSTGSTSSGAGIFIKAVGSNKTFKTIITSNGTTEVENVSFDFNTTSERFIRKRFNTNPTLTNDDVTDNATTYWLGETFEGNLNDKVGGSVTARTIGVILPIGSPDETVNGGYYKVSSTKNVAAESGWFISQDLSDDFSGYDPASMTKLFKFVGRSTREDVQNNIKVSIQNLRKSNDPDSPYGSFTVAIRDIKDTDDRPVYLEQYNNCNLNPASDNYIAKKIGDKYETWDYASRNYKEYGDYPNASDFIRVEVADDVRNGVVDATLIPFGVFGPPRYISFGSDAGRLTQFGSASTYITTDGTFVKKGQDYAGTRAEGDSDNTFYTASGSLLAGWQFPELRLRLSSSEGFVSDPTDAYFGVDTTYDSNQFNNSVYDVLRAKADSLNSHTAGSSSYTENSWVFSLDNIRNVNVSASSYTGAYAANAVYDRAARNSELAYNNHTLSAGEDNVPAYSATASYINVLDAGFDKFTTCLFGGFDALDITERDPFRNSGLEGKTEENDYAYNTVNVALDSLRDAERVEYNLLAMPGLTNNALNAKMVRVCEDRGDALAIIDLKGGYEPDTENTNDIADRIGSVRSTVDNLNYNLRINSSYGGAYYPWVQIRDTVNGATLWAPPSVAAIGSLAYSEAVSALWFAPAGFTRGGLSANNAAGIPVVGVRQRLTSKDRDKLYESNINPIATFPAEGIVIFGQKTLQLTPSALDRINVRRLTIFLKKRISQIAATLLFDQNVDVTWQRFKGQVETLLGGVKTGLGLTAYKVVLDDTTTTPDLIDRNIMYAKIFVKPARAIEFIAIDFVITDSGAAFED